jgi:signal peptidase II
VNATLRRLVPWLALAAAVAAADLATKHVVESVLRPGEVREITSFFNLVLAYNRGAAFSFLSDASGWQRYVFIATTLAAIAVILVLLARPLKRWLAFGLALILGGAIGNLWNRVALGSVVDFLDFYAAGYHWPAFNLADSAITVGAALLILDALRGER